jgi:hypothetical protein
MEMSSILYFIPSNCSAILRIRSSHSPQSIRKCLPYPSHFIQASFGTTTSGTGTANCALHIDFFGFAWNPGVNGGSGTPNSVKPRYW